MWFKQLQLFQLPSSISNTAEHLIDQLEPLIFRPCLPSMPLSMGWVPVIDEADSPLVSEINHCMMFCLQVEEKILPAAVIRQAVVEKIKAIEMSENRRIRQKERLALKDEIVITLLPRAFTKLTRIYAYIDVTHHWLILGTVNPKKTEQFLSLFKKSLGEQVQPFSLKKLSFVMAHWLKEKSYPPAFSVEKTGVLQDPNQQNRIIRCQQQDLFASSIQSLIKEGCEVKQLALSWQEQINFVLSDDFSLRTIQFQDEIKEQAKDMEPETKQQQFDTDFLIMTKTLSQLLTELLDLFIKPQKLQGVAANESHRLIMN